MRQNIDPVCEWLTALSDTLTVAMLPMLVDRIDKTP